MMRPMMRANTRLRIVSDIAFALPSSTFRKRSCGKSFSAISWHLATVSPCDTPSVGAAVISILRCWLKRLMTGSVEAVEPGEAAIVSHAVLDDRHVGEAH